ncbi:UDP-glucose 4-epimerase GalE [Pantoea sp. Mhis]|uniref:UDP-glucose 4-epimerase GalE n=1 Tax=Pantoea sp. Mhis TaxID=2576759 RepID=UPI00135A95D4|nr:UDP-glucose 4-epimerase GalE [Pantoea sp. Mhis]MXP56155.1 UDP-glucose 4-epimerase GalE [Pantoea sp. Mhis]
MAILVTGGAGYIGSHTVLILLKYGIEVVILDNLCNASHKIINRLEKITNKKLIFIENNIVNRICLKNLFKKYDISTVMHFAALKSINDSLHQPLLYYSNNVTGTIILLEEMLSANIRNFIFSSSATVYGIDSPIPYCETNSIGHTTNPYSTSKLMIEFIIRDFVKVNPSFKAVALRYFNPVGAHESGELGENSTGVPNNLLPYIAQVALGRLKKLNIFGNNYNTPDGTAQRDYLHVIDLAEGHLNVLNHLPKIKGYKVYNFGSGKIFSVLEVIKIFEKISGKKILFEYKPRREGDLPSFWADTSLAKNELGWQAKRDIYTMIRDMWNWYIKNPNGLN